MSNIEIYIIVEGQTEQVFVREVLAQNFAHKGIFLHPVLIGSPGHKGGSVNFERAKKDIGNFLRQRHDIYVSTMYDYFRIDSRWPGRETIDRRSKNGAILTAGEKADIIEKSTHSKINEAFGTYHSVNRFIPYTEMHEFEALLFSDAEILADILEVEDRQIENIIETYENPEEINDDPEKAPSKRLEYLKTGYRKVVMGKVISEAVGIEKIREKCHHFNNWLDKLENLSSI